MSVLEEQLTKMYDLGKKHGREEVILEIKLALSKLEQSDD